MRIQCKARLDLDQCERTSVARGFCDPHYRQVRAGQKPGHIRTPRPNRSTLIRDEEGNKFCPACERWVAVEGFALGSSTADGLQIFCRPCSDSKRNQHHRDNPDARRTYWLFKRYGITPERLRQMLEAQNGCCAICLGSEPGGRGWQVDHDHECHPLNEGCPSCVRGVLCWSCNVALGKFRDDPETLRRAAAYIENHRA